MCSFVISPSKFRSPPSGTSVSRVWREKRSCSASVSVELSMGATSSALFGKRGMLTVLTSGEMDAPEKE